MIRKFLEREGQFLLQELGAPDWRTLWLRAAFWLYVTVFSTAGLLGIVAVYETFGLPAMYGVIFIIYLLCLRLRNRAPLSAADWDWLGGEPPALPPPGKPSLPPPGIPRLPSPGMRAISDNRSHTRR